MLVDIGFGYPHTANWTVNEQLLLHNRIVSFVGSQPFLACEWRSRRRR